MIEMTSEKLKEYIDQINQKIAKDGFEMDLVKNREKKYLDEMYRRPEA